MLSWIAAAAFCGLAAAKDADLILMHGRVFAAPGAYAQAVAIAGNRILLVGDDAGALALKGPRTRVLDLAGRAVTPGLHDAHARFFAGALALSRVDVSKAATAADLQRLLARYALEHPKDSWILGRGIDPALLDRPPTRQDLDLAVSSRPVALADTGGRRLWLNSEALRLAGIGKLTQFQGNGLIERDKSGEPTGVLDGDAIPLGLKAIPSPGEEEVLSALRQALALAREAGITAVDSFPDPQGLPTEREIKLWKRLYREGRATTRLFLYAGEAEEQDLEALRRQAAQLPPTRFGLLGLEAFVDGSLADRTAALLEPYFDDLSTRGGTAYTEEQLQTLVGRVHKLGLQAALHAAGDRGVRMALDACQASQKAAKQEGTVLPSYPCRIEGADLVSPDDWPRFAVLHAAVSLQPARIAFESQEQNDYPERVGDRVKSCFPTRGLEDASATVAFATGWPARPMSPALVLFAATSRQDLDGRPAGGWVPAQKTSIESALAHATIDAARAMGRDDEFGSLAPGKLADLVVFDRDIFAASGQDLLKARVDVTILDGRVVYQRVLRPTKP